MTTRRMLAADGARWRDVDVARWLADWLRRIVGGVDVSFIEGPGTGLGMSKSMIGQMAADRFRLPRRTMMKRLEPFEERR